MYSILTLPDAISFAFYGDDLLIPYPLYDDEWVHISATYDGLNRKIYVNGILMDEDTSDSPANVSGNSLALGFPVGSGHGNTIRYQGEMDNIKIWSRALNSEEVLNSYETNMDYDNSLLAYYKFNAGEGSMLYDHSGNQNHGQINGASWVETNGCTEEFACNYSSGASVDDGSCDYSCYDIEDWTLDFDGHHDGVMIGDHEEYDLSLIHI